MFRLRTFGGLWLEQDQRRVSGSTPRRLGMLAAVVASRDQGISRDRLLLLLWPDATESNARHALSQTLYSLRRQLGSELVLAEATELLTDTSQLTSDYTEFLEACAAGNHERAAALYTGPFLDGFYVPEAPEFERWAEVERSRLREQAIGAIESAARRAGEAGRIEEALGYWRRLALLAPHNSRYAAGLMTALADSGDVAGAIQHGRSHEVARRQEVGAQPDPGVQALLARLLKGEWRGTPVPAGTTAPGVTDSPAPAISESPPAPLTVPAARAQRRSPKAVAVIATLALLAAVATWRLWPMLARGSGFPAGSLIVLADPVDLSREPGLSRAVATAAAIGLQQSRRVSLLSPQRIAEALRRMGRSGDSVLSDSLALEVAAREDARAVLSLGVSRVSGAYLLTGRLLSPADGATLAVHRVTARGPDKVIKGLDDLVRRILRTAGESAADQDSLQPLPLVTTPSLEALKVYAEGAESWRRNRYVRALELFQRAIALDSGFALAHVAMGAYFYINNDRPDGDAHYAMAERLRARLTFREQLLLDSRLASARGDGALAAQIGGVIAERYPSRDTWYDYGSSLLRLGRCREGIPALQRALAYDSTWANIHINLATCYKVTGENRLALDAYAAAERADSTALVTFNINHEWGSVFVRLARYSEAEAAFGRMLGRPSASDRARGHRSLAYLDMLRGRYRAATQHLDSAVILSSAVGQSRTSLFRNQVLLAEAHLINGSPKLASRELDDALKVARGQFVEPGFLALLGRVLVRAGRLPDAHEVLRLVEAASKPTNPTDLSAQRLLRAELALARGATGEAAEAIRNDTDPVLASWRWSLSGRTFAARGVMDSALAVTVAYANSEGFGFDTQSDWVTAPLSLARIAESMGDSATARSALQRFLDRWSEGDTGLQLVVGAKLALARLQRAAGH